MNVDAALQSYLADCRIGLSAATLAIYERNLTRLAGFCRQRRIGRLERLRVDDLREHFVGLKGAVGDQPQAADGYSASTLHQHYRTIRTWLNWCVKRGHIHKNPILAMRAPPVYRPVARHIGLADIDRLLAASHHTRHPERDHAICMLFLDTGMRRKELADLRVTDLNLPEHMVTIHLGKMGRGRICPISSPAIAAVAAWLEVRPVRMKTLFGLGGPSIYEMLRWLKHRAGLADVTPHGLRHTFATYYAGDIYDLARILGHRDVNTTAEIYVHRDTARLAKIHDNRSPVGRAAKRGRR